MSTLQRDELLTQSKILEKETSPLANEANQHSEAEPYKTKHSQDLCGDTSHIESFNDLFGNLYRHLFQVLPWE